MSGTPHEGIPYSDKQTLCQVFHEYRDSLPSCRQDGSGPRRGPPIRGNALARAQTGRKPAARGRGAGFPGLPAYRRSMLVSSHTSLTRLECVPYCPSRCHRPSRPILESSRIRQDATPRPGRSIPPSRAATRQRPPQAIFRRQREFRPFFRAALDSMSLGT
jgi:hypothetical protein